MKKISEFGFKDEETGWNNPKKTKKQRELLTFRGSLLNQRMKYSLNEKIRMAQQRIKHAIRTYGERNCYIAFSGGKDSTILSHLVLSLGYKPEHVFSNTRLEYPECIAFAIKWAKKHKIKLTIVIPKERPEEVWKKYGYPMFSKESSEILERIRTRGEKNVSSKKIKKVKGFLKYKNVPLSSKCCTILKKIPMKEWQKKNGKNVAIMGIRAEESQMRRTVWVRKGCIYETKDQVVVHPIIAWTKKDINDYAKKHHIRFAKIYYRGMERNGCICCGFGCHMAKENNFQKLKRLYPHLWPVVMDKWGFRKICKKCDVEIE